MEAVEQRLLPLPKQPYGLYGNILSTNPGGDNIYKLAVRAHVTNSSVISFDFPINDPSFTQTRDGKPHKAMMFLQNFVTDMKCVAGVQLLDVRVSIPNYQSTAVGVSINSNAVTSTTRSQECSIATYAKVTNGTGVHNFTDDSVLKSGSLFAPQYILTSFPFNSIRICFFDLNTEALAIWSDTTGTIVMDFTIVLID